MTFAITLETSDLNYLGGCITAADTSNITQQDKNLARHYWQGGINDWPNAPLWGADPNCTECRVVVCTYGTAAEFCDLLRRISAVVGLPNGTDTQYLLALVADLILTDIHEPWPPA